MPQDWYQKLKQGSEPNQRAQYGAISARVIDFIEMYTDGGRFTVRDLYDHCNAGKDENIRIAVRQCVFKLKKDQVIEPTGNQAGCYRKVDRAFKFVPLAGLEESPPVDVKLPLGADHHVELMEKDLVVYAGVPNAGKSAFMLETVRLNMGKHKCFYFSSEMSARNCAKRLSKAEGLAVSEWTFNFCDDFQNYLDVIHPDALNFIDYVEAEDGEFFKIPSILTGIQRKLKTGLAFVALQKNPGDSSAIGGHQTRAKPSLFCTIENHTFTILKAKNWNGTNPNGFKCQFKIIGGINLIREGGWMAP